MTSHSEILSEKQIIAMLQENNLLAWTSIYDKYAPAMYGVICKLTDDPMLAEEIFTNAFLDLKQKQTPFKIKFALLAVILRHTHSYTINHLEKNSITPKTFNPPKKENLIHLLTTQCNTVNQAGSILSIKGKETRKRLRVEFLNLRMQNNSRKTGKLTTNVEFLVRKSAQPNIRPLQTDQKK